MADYDPELASAGVSALTPIAEGGSSWVYRARLFELDKPIAIKVMKAPLRNNRAIDAFRAELAALSRLSFHPNILQVYSVGVLPDRRPYIISELCVGSLASVVDARAALNEDLVIKLVAQVASALLAVHGAGFVHGDVTPGNILLRESGGPVLADFGSTVMHSNIVRRRGYTASYAAPEVLAGRAVDERSDVYGLGATLYSLLSGSPPFWTDTFWSISSDADAAVIHAVLHDEPAALPRSVSRRVRALIRHMIMKDASERPSIAAATAQLLEMDRSARTVDRGQFERVFRLMARPGSIRSQTQTARPGPTPGRLVATLEPVPVLETGDSSVSDLLQDLEARSAEIQAEVAAERLGQDGLWLPISVYVSGSDGSSILRRITRAANLFDFDIAYQARPEGGSWFGRLWLRTKQLAGKEEVRERARKLESALELELLGKRRADVDKTKAEAIAAILSAVKEQDKAIVRIGSILIVKVGNAVRVETITEQVASELEKNPALLRSPGEAMDFLAPLWERATAIEVVSSADDATIEQPSRDDGAGGPC